MAKKLPAPKKPAAAGCKQLIDAIATVKQLQDFVKDHGSLDAAVATAARVHCLIEMTGGFDALREALEIVGRGPEAPPQAST